jgi:hypothetical protein
MPNSRASRADAVTFFVGSILFTLGGLPQSWLAWPERGMSEFGGVVSSFRHIGAVSFVSLSTGRVEGP